MSLRLELADDAMDTLVERIAERIGIQTEPRSPWMNFAELVEYTRIPEGTVRKMTACGEIPRHGGQRSCVYHRDEVDRALGYSPAHDQTRLRRVS